MRIAPPGQRVGSELRGRLVEHLRRDAVGAGHVDLAGMIGEIEVDNPWLERMARRGAMTFDFEYLQLPGLNGLAALRGLKRSAATREIPVIVVTVSGDPLVRQDAIESGCEAFLTKPVEATELASVVTQTLPAARSRTSRARFTA